MEHYSFENQMKDALGERSITPSNNAWNRIAADIPKKKKKNHAFWLWTAAAITLLLVSVGVYQNENSTKNITPAVVNQEINNKKTPVEPKQNKSFETENNNVITTHIVAKENSVHAIDKNTNTTVKENKFTPKPKHTKNKVNESLATSNTAEDKKVNEVINSLIALENQGSVITDATIDSLLQKAQKELAIDRAWQDANGKVDHLALLNEVEDEIAHPSFKQKVYEVIEQGFITIKSAVADRNN